MSHPPCVSPCRTTLLALLTILFGVALARSTNAQSATYHLHKEASSTTGLFQLKTAGPDATTLAVQSSNLKSQQVGEYLIKAFDTQSGVPNKSGVIPAGSTVTFTLWMKKTSASGVIYPRAKLLLNSASGTLICTTTGSTALTTTLTKYTLSATSSAAVSMTTADRFYLWVGVNVTTAPTSNTNGEVDIEGTLNGNYDSQIVVPLPTNPPSVSITSPANGASFSGPTNITISAAASDSDSTISKVEFFQGSTKLGEKTTSPYDFTWTNASPASYGYSLTAKATDNAGATTTSSAVNIIVSGAGSLFDSTVLPTTGTSANLTAEGSADWAHWGTNTAASFDRKSGASQISNYTLIGTQAVQRLTDSTVSYSWTDGTPTASAANNTTGIFTSAANNGFQITVPADTTPKTLKIYLGSWYAQVKVEATLSDGSALALVDTSFGQAGFSDAIFTINFKAASAGQTLTVKCTIFTDYNPPFGNIRLESAALAPNSTGGSGSLSGSIATPTGSVNLTTEGTTDWTHWGMGSAAAFDHKTGVAAQISNFTKIGTASVLWLNGNPTLFSWTDGTPTISASNTDTGVYIQGVGNGFQFSVPADTELKTLKIYSGVWKAQGKLEATLSDGSAATFTDSSLSNSSGTSNGVYSISFKAGSNGQSLRIKYSDVTDYVSGANVTLEGTTLSYVPPAISSLSSVSAPVGTAITITGSNFGLTLGTSTVTFNGVTATPASWSSTSIVAPVPATATSGPVIVTVRGAASNSQSFTVVPGITGLSPTTGAVGDAVTISGTTFGATQGTSTVTFNGSVATPTNWSNTSVVAPVPSGATTGAVVVTVGGSVSNGVTFTVGPKINSLAPTSGAVGDSITISGTNFGSTQGTSTITFSGTSASPSSWSANTIIVPVPAGATTGSIVVTVGGLASNGVTFTVGPKINNLSPTSGAVGASVIISGSTFGATQGTSTVTFNGTTATPTSWGANSITVAVPAGASTGPVVVTVGGLASNGVTFTVAPKINSLSPTSGAAGDSVTISGTNFGATQGTSTVTFNGTTATPSNWSATSITVPVPADATTGVVVVTAGGSASNGVSFTVIPKINNLTPSSGAASESITISGTTFGASQGTSTVTFNGTTAVPTSWSTTSIAVPVPSGATSGPVVVTVGGIASSGLAFTVTTTGTISGKVTVAGGTTPIPGATVKALQGTTVVATATTNGTGDYALAPLTVGSYSVEASGTGYGTKRQNLVTITAETTTDNLSLDAIVNGPLTYIYDAAGRLISTVGPTDTVIYSYDAVGNLLSISRQSSGQVSIIQMSPNSGPIGIAVTISGTGFSANASQNTITFNGVAATITSATPTQIITNVPSGATTGPVGVTSPNGSATSNTSFTVTDGTGGPPTISSFTPNVGAAGDSVTISGTNFELTPTDNKLRFSGSSAAVSSSTATSIVGAVPPTGSGHISVTTTAGSATSTADFYVAPSPRPASDVEFTSRSSLGGLTNVTINTPGKIGLVVFDALAGQRVTISFTNITMGRVRVSLINPNGTVLTGPIYEYSYPGWAVIDPISLPASGTYTVVLDGYDPITYSYSGSLSMQLYNTPPDVTGVITPGGPSIPVSITTPGQLARLTFSGTAGQAISLNVTGSPVPASWLTIYKPDGSNLIGQTNIGGANLGFIDRQVLPASGTYTIVIDPQGTNIGNFNVTLYNLVDVSGTLTPDAGATPVNITVPGQNASFTFNGTTGQQVSLAVTGVTMSPTTNTSVIIYKPDGSTFVSDTVYSWMNQIVFDAQTLPVSGTYRVFVDPASASTGSLNLALYNAPDVNDAIAIGETKTITVPVVGQRANVIFNGTAGQTVGLNMTNPTMSVQVSVWKPDGSGLIGATSAPGFIQMANLPATGAYTFLVDPQGTATGNLTLTVYDNSLITGTLAVNGSGITITNNPGQNALLTFDGTAGQQVTVHFSGNTVGSIYAQLQKPDGSLLNDAFSGAGSFIIGTVTLPTAGTYKISVDPWDLNAGSVTITVTNP